MVKAKQRILDIRFQSEIEIELEQGQDGTAANSRQSAANQGKGKVWEYLALASIPLVLVLGNSMLIPVLPQMQRALQISQFQSSLTISLFSITAGLFIPILGYLSDRFSRKIIIIPALILYGSAGILAGFGAIWKSYGVVITARALQGLGAAGTSSIAMALIGDMYQGGEESRALGLVEASNGLGKVLSPIIGSLLALIIWYAVFFSFPVFCGLSLLAVIFLIQEPKSQDEPKKLKAYLQSIGSILKEKGRWLITSFFAGSLGLFILFGALFYLSQILEEKPYEIEGVLKGLILAIPLMGMVTTSYITGSVIKKNGVLIRWLMNIGLAVMTVSLGLSIFLYKNIYLLIGFLTLSSIGTGLLLPCLNTMITGAAAKSERGMITSLYNSLRFIGVAFGPPLFSWMMSVSNELVFITVSVLALITLGLIFFLIKPDRKLSEA
ncbi:putative MFS-type transporter YitG [Insulibacter thermoxylanivorax]|uniref:MFS-type transporter YitG n=1 Tax=Insulibacter thermoxylanivorax TaxID=2749268 RepID=A0A916QEB2_9BACL|nr:MFS transporter [Insulibacter thermoxylanivorax]GFR37843.1 putative MFS-type transporter YitG [Insulibacter thermoxylanivorax]